MNIWRFQFTVRNANVKSDVRIVDQIGVEIVLKSVLLREVLNTILTPMENTSVGVVVVLFWLTQYGVEDVLE